jgi:ribonuclease BN (tRNA processing enzyme)
VRLSVLGSNGTYPTPGHPASGYLFESDDSAVWVDAGPGTFPALASRRDPATLDALVLTHVHGDHCLDVFPLFGYLRYRVPRPDPLRVFSPAGVAERLAGFAGAGPQHDFFRVFDFRTVSPGDTAAAGDLTLRFGEAVHPVPTVGVRVAAGGGDVVYTSDTGPGDGPARLAEGAAVLLCEATFAGRREEGDYPYHLYAAEAGSLADAAGVGRLLVTHLAPTLAPEEAVAEAAVEFAGPVEWAAPGMEVQV